MSSPSFRLLVLVFLIPCVAIVNPARAGRCIAVPTQEDTPAPPEAASQPADDGDTPPTPAAALARARRFILEGFYEKAEQLLDRAESDATLKLHATLARVDIDERLGRYDEAARRLASIEAEGAASADWRAAQAALCLTTGDYAAGIEHGREALRINREHFRARYVLGRLYETTGRIDEAVATYRWFDDLLKRRLPDRAGDLTYTGMGFLRHTTLTRHPDIKQRIKHVLQEVYQEASDFVDSAWWPARMAAADLLLEKHNTQEAESEYEQIRRMNARVAEADVGLARVALEKWDFDLVEKRAAQALQINPNCVAAHCVLAECRMLERRYADAAEAAKKSLAINPNSIEALSLLAAARLRSGDAAACREIESRIDKINPRCAELPFTMGKWLSAARQYEAAAQAFKKAIEWAPWWSEPRTELGLMYMQSGHEDEARRVLEASWALDSYNAETYNVLELLDALQSFARRESPNFILCYSKDEDAVLVPWMLNHLESMHAEVCRAFETTPPRKTLIEIFPEHSQFSVRIAGRPWIATVGACTGPVIAMSAPRQYASPSPLNWSDVLRHEYTHTVTLAATENRIPHWMTEGLAVHQETAPRSWDTRLLLCRALRTRRLFTLESIDWGFMRPRRHDDRSLAYAQSEWMIEYIIERWGYPKVLALLTEFRENRTQPEAFKRILGIDTDRFIADFGPWAAKQVESWNLPTDSVGEIAALKAALLLKPNDADAHARLAEALLLDEQLEEFEKSARAALERNKEQPLALALLGGFLVEKAGQLVEADRAREAGPLFDEADRFLRRLKKLRPNDPAALKYLARIEEHWNEPDAAAELWTAYKQVRPLDPECDRRLAALHLLSGRRAESLPLLENAFRMDSSDIELPRKIAEIHRANGRLDEAATWLRRAIETDSYDQSTYAELGAVCLELKDWENAELAFRSICTLSPDDPDGYEGLARVFDARGDDKQAEKMRKTAAVKRGLEPEPAEKPL
ncbi:MAG: tetratricopeptide repeat protein [Phycisphaerae bacterium]|nr:tetratricopeptide repeat protein [Phycisphaerae bacterium]